MSAIAERRYVHLQYDGKPRKLEAYALGRNERNEDVLLGKQVSPWLPEQMAWQVLPLDKVYGLLVLETQYPPSERTGQMPPGLLSGVRLQV